MLQARAEQSPMSATSTSRAEPSERSEPALNADTRIGLRGIGPSEAGMTIAEAEEVADVSIIAQEFTTFGGSCYHAYAEGLEEDFDFLVQSPGPGAASYG